MSSRALTDHALKYETTRKFNGHLKLPKSFPHVLWHEFGIKGNELMLYLHLASSAGFDSRNRHYTKTPYTVADLKKVFKNFHSKSVENWVEALKQQSLINIEPDGLISINNYELIFQKGINLGVATASETLSISIYKDMWVKIIKQPTERSE